ncbi:hypothetical protein PTKIN_Ptkin01aG0150300 [Pterospermum kingtungense]
MRTLCSNLYQNDNNSCFFTSSVPHGFRFFFENLTKSNTKSVNPDPNGEDFLDFSQAFCYFSACSSDISGKLKRLVSLPSPKKTKSDVN